MSRWVYLLGVGLALVALAFVVTDWVIGPSPGVTEANARRIKPGMKLGEVEAILGARGVLRSSLHMVGGSSFTLLSGYYEWTGPDVRVVVGFALSISEAEESELKVVRVRFERTASPNPLARLRTWLGW
jgi:hypothetical protein